VDALPSTWRSTVFRSLQLPPGSIYVLLFVISWRYRLTASARTVVGLSQLPARGHGTHCQHTFVVWRTAPLHLDDYLRLICFMSTSVYSALGVSAIMRYINGRFTYFLTYLLTGVLSAAAAAAPLVGTNHLTIGIDNPTDSHQLTERWRFSKANISNGSVETH